MNTKISINPFHELIAELQAEFRRLSPAKPSAERTAFPAMLELKGIKVTYPEIEKEYFKEEDKKEDLFEYLKEKEIEEKKDVFCKGLAVTCKNWMCPDCRPIKGFKLRADIMKKSNLMKIPRLYAITICRDWFKSPEEAYNYVMNEKFIARLLTKEMKVRRWLWVLEFQEKSGDGWPHWHILIDIGDLPGMWYNRTLKKACKSKPENENGWHYIPHFFDLNKVHRLLRKWKIGEQCKLSLKKRKFLSPSHAINYITKYLIKTPKRGYPSWALNHKGLRFYQPSKEIGSFSTETTVKKQVNDKTTIESKKTRKPPVERIAECKTKIMFQVYSEKQDRNFLSRPVYGLKDSIPLFSGSATIQDFDFKTQKPYSIHGFKNINDINAFRYIWQKKEMLLPLADFIDKKEKFLLSQWDSFTPESGNEPWGSSEAESPRDITDNLKEISFSQPRHFARRTMAKTEAEQAGLSVAV